MKYTMRATACPLSALAALIGAVCFLIGCVPAQSAWKQGPAIEMPHAEAIIVTGQTFSFAPFNTTLQPLIDEALCEHGKDRYRKGTLLIPNVLIWLVLVMTLRRDLNTDRVLNPTAHAYGAQTLENRHPDGAGHPRRNSGLPSLLADD